MLEGHTNLVRDFQRLVKAGKLAHAYIFFGDPEVGKFYFARHLANFLENGEMDLPTRLLQDGLILEEVRGIEEMRQIKNFLWQKPAVSVKRLVVVNDAHNLTPQAQNAILKITEEPPEHSLIILVTSQPDNLLPALLSRAQKIHFGRLSDSEMEEITGDKQIAESSFGRPGRAARLLSDPLVKEAEQYANKFLKLESGARSGLIKELVDSQKDHPELLDRFFEALLIRLRKDLKLNFREIRSVLHRLFLIKSYNTNKRLQLEAI